MKIALASDHAGYDLKAVRGMIDAGSGYPPHWRGEGGDVNLATAEAMQGPPERHLARRQGYFAFVLQDILYHAYQRAAQLGKVPPLPAGPPGYDYAQLFTVQAPDVSLRDNTMLAQAAGQMAQAMSTLKDVPPELAQLALELVLKFAGEEERVSSDR